MSKSEVEKKIEKHLEYNPPEKEENQGRWIPQPEQPNSVRTDGPRRQYVQTGPNRWEEI